MLCVKYKTATKIMNAHKLPNVVYTTGLKNSVTDMQTLS